MWRPEAGAALEKIRASGAEVLLPVEFRGIEESYSLGNRYMDDGDCENAEKQYILTLRNAEALEKKLAEEKTRLEEIRNLKENIEKKEHERQKALEEKAKDQEQKRELPEKPKRNKERALAATHTVKRGETLPYIASLPEVYNDSSLWPLLYRANRDQISDPNYIWPGQVLRIPRNQSREDITDAGKSAQE
jgi:nucleoid-associated protein YgaU